MVMDRNNRSHRPKGTPDGGRYEARHTAMASADVMPPVTAGGDTTVMDRARERGLSWDMLAGRGGNGRAANLTARGGEGTRMLHAEPDGHGGWDLTYREWRKPTLREYNGPGIHPFGVFGWMADRMRGDVDPRGSRARRRRRPAARHGRRLVRDRLKRETGRP